MAIHVWFRHWYVPLLVKQDDYRHTFVINNCVVINVMCRAYKSTILYGKFV